MVGLPLSELDLVLLAGGRGERMGGAVKPLLTRPDGKSLLAAAVDVLPGRTAWVVAPAVRQDRLRVEVEDLDRPDRPVCLVTDPGEGPGWAILAAARVSQAKRLLIVGGDHVRPGRRLAERLIAAVTDHGVGGAWTLGEDGRPEPLFSVVDRQALLTVASDPPRSATRLLLRLDPHPTPWAQLSEAERSALEDVDTVEDAVARGLSGHGPE